MPKKSPTRNEYTPIPFNGFIDLNLTDAQLESQKAWKIDPETLLDGVLKLCEEGYAMKLRWDSYNECHQCTITPQSRDHAYAGWYLTGRGSSPEKAIKQCLWLHYHVLDTVWPVADNKPRRKDKFE